MEKLTREALFDLVWTAPMTKLAARFGVSNVALAKTCARFDIPRPGRGYWQQIAAGAKPKRPRLPASKVDRPVVMDWGLPMTSDPLVVAIPDQLVEPHEAVQWLQGDLASARPDEHGRLVIGGGFRPSFSITPTQVPRMLRLLDWLAKALAARGWKVLAAKRFAWSKSAEFLIQTPGSMFAVEVEEKFFSKLPSTVAVNRRGVTLRSGSRRTQEVVASGELCLKLMFTPKKYVGRKAWWDEGPRRLDEQLGRVVVAVETAAHIGKIEHEERVRLHDDCETAERKRLRPERLRSYKDWLGADLDQMVTAWDRARRLREFLDEYERRLPEGSRSAVTAEWMQMARGLTERLDPMSRMSEVAKELDPSDSVLAQLAETAKDRLKAGK
jgi:hypothetical protein